MRLTLFDGIRGHLLIGMLITHLSFNQGLEFLRFFHHNILIQLYDAEFFIFIAGLLVGYLWDRRHTSGPARVRFTLNRLSVIYRYYVISALPFLINYVATGNDALAGTLGVLTMQMGGWYSDILPIYFVCFLLLLPFAVWSVLYRPLTVLTLSGALYAGSQMTNLLGFFGFSGRFVAFDIAAWQFVFFASMIIGRNVMAWRDAIRALPSRIVLTAFPLLVILLVWFGQFPWFPDPMALRSQATDILPRMALHPLYVVRIAVAIAAFSLIFLRTDAFLAPLNRAVHWYFSLAVLRNVGRYSIQMFALHVYITGIYFALVEGRDEAHKVIYALVSIAVFIAAPNIVVAMKDRTPVGLRAPRSP